MINKVTIFQNIEKTLGNDYILAKKNISNYPYVYSKNFEIFEVEGPFSFVLILPLEVDIEFDLIKAVYLKTKKDFNKKIIVYLHNSSNKIKRLYDVSNISYISSDGDLHILDEDKIPFIEENNKEAYTKKTQLLVNFYLSNKIREYSVREVAEKLRFSNSSVSRANVFLNEIGALDKIGVGTNSKYVVKSKKELLDKVKPYLINPIKSRKVVSFDETRFSKNKLFLSGENAFSFYSDIDEGGYFKELAISSYEDIKIDNSNGGNSVCYLEEFIYDPSIFANGNVISIFDAYIISFDRHKNDNDPRIVNALKQMERKIING